MYNKIKYGFYLAGILLLAGSCKTANIVKYYSHNKGALDSIDALYKQQYAQNKFSVMFTDRSFNTVSLELYTDSIKYIYEFGINEERMDDSLKKYHLSPARVGKLITKMRLIHSTWINNLDYYVDGQKKFLVYMSIRPEVVTFPLSKTKYYILTYFPQPQYYDAEGRLLDKRKRRRLREINGEVFRRINDKVAYTISGSFR